MAGPGGTEVGRVSIRVLPDTSKFRRQLERELNAIARGVTVKVPVELDTKNAIRQLAQLRARLAGLRGGNISVGVDTTTVTNTIRKTTTEAKTLRGVLAGLTNSAQDGFKKVTSGIETARIRASLFGGVLKRMWDREPIDNYAAAFKSIGRGLKNVGKSALDADLSFRKLRRTGSTLGKGLGGGLAIIGKSLKGITDIGTLGATSFGELGRVGKIVVAVIAALPALLGLISGLLAGLPSLLSAIGAGALVVALGIDGIKNAFSTFMETLGPLRERISATFEKGLAPQFAAVSKMLYTLEPALQKVAGSLVTMAQGFTNAITSAQGVKQINTILQNTATFFSSLKPAMEQFTQGFLTLASAGSQQFGLLSTVINNFAKSWNDLATRMTSNGSFQAAIEGLAKVTDSLLQGFLKLFEAGVQAMGVLGGPLANAISSLVDLFVALIPAITPLTQVILQVISALGQALTPILQAITPLITQFAQQMAGFLVPAIQALAPGLQAFITFAFQLLNALSPLFPVLTQIANVLSNVMVAAMNALAPVLPVIANVMQQVADVINGALAAAMPVLEQIAQALGQAIVDAINALAPILPGLIKAFLDLVQALLPLLPPLIQLIGAILPPLIQLFGSVGVPVIQLATKIVSVLVPAVNGIIDVLTTVIRWLGSFATSIGNAVGDVIRWFTDLPGRIFGALGDVGSWLWNTGRNLIQGLINGIGSMAQAALDKVKSIGNTIVGGIKSFLGIGSPSRVFMQIGEWLMQGLQIGVDRSGADAVKSVEDVARKISGVGTDMAAEVQASGGLTYTFDRVYDAIVDALNGWGVQIDQKGLAKLVNEANQKNKNGR